MDNHKPIENKNDTSEKMAHKKCVCLSLQGLFIPNRQLSVAVSGCIALLFFSFMTGYFFGSQHAAHDFMHQVDHVSFNDQMSASLCALAKDCTTVNTSNKDDISTQAMIDAGETDESTLQEYTHNGIENSSAIACSFAEASAHRLAKEEASVPTLEINKDEKKYYAQLIGFGTEQAAQRFAKKLAKKQIPVEINTHCSRTAQGKTINWYQVVTIPYDDKKQLLDLVATIQKTEKIQDVRIVAC